MGSFAKAVKVWSDKTGESVDDIVTATATDLARRVIQRTPVGEPSLWKSPPPPGYTGGQAKGNWFATLGAPSSAVGAPKDKTGAATIDQAAKVAINAAGNIFYLVNNLPYIRRLEYEGWSSQAPQGMVRITVTEFNQSIKKAIRENT
jgi:hypothetical protein